MIRFKVTRRNVILKDNPLYPTETSNLTYYHFHERITEFETAYDPYNKFIGAVNFLNNGNPLFNFIYNKDSVIVLEERNRFTFTNALSLTGGFSGVINLIFLVIGNFV